MSTESRVTLLLQGGMGNQLCQIVFALYLTEQLNATLEICSSLLDSNIRAFRGLSSRKIEPVLLPLLYQYPSHLNKQQYYMHRLYMRLGRQSSTFYITDANFLSVAKLDFNLSCSNIIIKSHCASAYLFRPCFSKYWLHLAAILGVHPRNDRQISMHIRRGDYVKWPHLYRLLDSEYFLKALDKISQTYPPHLFALQIVTDSPDWAMNQPWPESIRSRICCSSGSSTLDDFLALSSSQGICISNSTFSATSAHIAELISNDVCIVAPRLWFPDGDERNHYSVGVSIGDMRRPSWTLA